jgi:hypothetical protein
MKKHNKSKLHEKKVIKEVLKYISKKINQPYRIISYPDEVNRNSPACDMLVSFGDKKFAIEHTSIDSIPNQRRDSNRFIKLLSPLENELDNKLPTPGHYQLVIDMDVIPALNRSNGSKIYQSIKDWCIKIAPTLSMGGTHSDKKHFSRDRIPGVPFKITLYKWPRRDGEFRIARFSPEQIEEKRKEVFKQALCSRGEKVINYKKEGYYTILVLESNDRALANFNDIGDALNNAIEELKNVELPDEIYLIETEIEDDYEIYCLKCFVE